MCLCFPEWVQAQGHQEEEEEGEYYHVCGRKQKVRGAGVSTIGDGLGRVAMWGLFRIIFEEGLYERCLLVISVCRDGMGMFWCLQGCQQQHLTVSCCQGASMLHFFRLCYVGLTHTQWYGCFLPTGNCDMIMTCIEVSWPRSLQEGAGWFPQQQHYPGHQPKSGRGLKYCNSTKWLSTHCNLL